MSVMTQCPTCLGLHEVTPQRGATRLYCGRVCKLIAKADQSAGYRAQKRAAAALAGPAAA